MKNQYNKTITACFVGYIVQAVVNNFTPLLFLFFQKSYHVPISQITLLVTFNLEYNYWSIFFLSDSSIK